MSSNANKNFAVECLVDSGAGFFTDSTAAEIIESISTRREAPPLAADGIAAGEPLPTCEECKCDLIESFLLDKFEVNVCNSCRKALDPKYRLISKTGAKTQYLLKDCDFDQREPHLKYILRRNPHKPVTVGVGKKPRDFMSRGAEMKLYLDMHVKQRALEIWESMEKIEEEKNIRSEKARVLHDKRFKMQLHEMRKNIETSRTAFTTSNKSKGRHVHSFVATSEEGKQKCDECGQVICVEQL